MQPETARVKEKWVMGPGGNPPGQGPFMEVRLLVWGERIMEAKYETYQCPACHDCGKAICEMVRERSLEEARAIKWDTLSARVGPLPRNQSHCVGLALLALTEALGPVEEDGRKELGGR